MDTEGFRQAGRAIEGMHCALETLGANIESDGNFDYEAQKVDIAQQLEAWEQYLTLAGRAYNKLKASCKSGSAKGWFDIEVRIRKNDPLLSYIWQARHSLEHKVSVDRLVKVWPEPNTLILKRQRRDQKSTSRSYWLLCVPIENRDVANDIPSEHLGKSLEQTTLNYMAKTARPHFDRMIEEATQHF